MTITRTIRPRSRQRFRRSVKSFRRKRYFAYSSHTKLQRTALLFKEFQTAFDAAHETLILPVYRVEGRDAVIPNRDSEALVHAIQKKQPRKPIFYLANPGKLKDAIIALDGAPLSKKVIVMMGAGDVVKLTEKLLK